MGLGYGYQSAFAIMEEQTSWGQSQKTPNANGTNGATTGTRWMYLAKNGDNLEFKRRMVESQSITSIGQALEFNLMGEYDVTGSITFPVPNEGSQWLWKHLMGQDDLWDIELSAQANTFYMHRYKMKDSLETETGSAINGTGSAGTAATVYGLQMFVYRGSVTAQQFYCTGVKILKAEFNVRPHEDLMCTLTIAGKAFGTQAMTVSTPAPRGFFNWYDLTVFLGDGVTQPVGGPPPYWPDTSQVEGSIKGIGPSNEFAVGVLDWNLTIDNQLELDRFFVSNKDGNSLYRGEPVRKNKVKVTSKMTLELDSKLTVTTTQDYDRFAKYAAGDNIKADYVFGTNVRIPNGVVTNKDHDYRLDFRMNAITADIAYNVPGFANIPGIIGQRSCSKYTAFPEKAQDEGRIRVPIEITHYRSASLGCNELEIHLYNSVNEKYF